MKNDIERCKSIIESIRNSDFYIEHIYMRGGCYQFHLILKSIFPSVLPFIHQDRDHVVSLISGKLFDIKGIIDDQFECLYSPLISENDLKMCQSWSFHKNNLLQICECPNCDEPICYNP